MCVCVFEYIYIYMRIFMYMYRYDIYERNLFSFRIQALKSDFPVLESI